MLHNLLHISDSSPTTLMVEARGCPVRARGRVVVLEVGLVVPRVEPFKFIGRDRPTDPAVSVREFAGRHGVHQRKVRPEVGVGSSSASDGVPIAGTAGYRPVAGGQRRLADR